MRPFPVIRNFKQYFWKNLLPGLLIVIGGIIFLNFFLAWRLENYLKQEIGERVSTASDGFYSLTFDDLAINILNGELQIQGIQLHPDSATFSQWQMKDSLPSTYIDATIGKIDFKGINLIWLRNYRKLNFHSFEIAEPNVHIVDAFYSDRRPVKTTPTRSKTLYEYIEPYIDILSVNRLNVADASVSFLVENPFTPLLYKIEEIDFYAYDFRLDSASFRNGKLLYCDNFEFISDRPQTILSNNHFLLKTDTLLVNTRDSLILLKDIELIQRNTFRKDTTETTPEVVSGEIPSIQVTGAGFKRVNAFNIMHARTLEVDSSNIHLAIHQTSAVHTETDSTKQINPIDSLSLYDFISPVLKQLAIDWIDIKNTRIDYSRITNDETDQFRVSKLDVLASEFLIDSIYEEKYGIRYSQNIAIKADTIEAYLSSQNHHITADGFLFDTRSGILRLENANFTPISLKDKRAILDGDIPLLYVHASEYRNGLTVNSILLNSPTINYRTSLQPSKRNPSSPFTPYFQFITVNDILLKNGKVDFQNRSKGERYRINGIEGHLSGFHMSEETLRSKENLDFICEKVDLRVTNFDSYLSNGNYRLRLKNGRYSNESGILDIKNIHLGSVEKYGNSLTQPIVTIDIPHLQITGLQEIWKSPQYIEVDSVKINFPVIGVRETGTTSTEKVKQKVKEYTPFQPFLKLDIKHIGLTGTQINYKSDANEQGLDVYYNFLNVEQAKWNLEEQRSVEIETFKVASPHVKWQTGDKEQGQAVDSTKSKTIPEILYPYAEKLTLHNLYVDDILLETKQPYLSTEFDVKNFQLDSLSWIFKEEERKMSVGNIQIADPTVYIARQPSPALTAGQEADTIKTSIYDQMKILGNDIDVHSIQITNGNIGFDDTISPDTIKSQKLNKTDFLLTDLQIDNDREKFAYEDIYFRSHDFSIPISQGFYTLDMGMVEFHNQNLVVESFHMNPTYEKMIFAYMHPRHADWFDVTFDRLEVKEIDLKAWFNDSLIHIAEVIVDNPFMQNFKNKQLYVPPKWMPMIYEGLQKAPVGIDIEKIRVNNFGVIYEELSKNGTEPGRLLFTELNGTFTGFTNIVSSHDQYIRLDADGKFYDQGHFEAVWLLPVDSLNDRFILEAYLQDMDLTLLNEMIVPLASAQLTGGNVNGLTFRMDAGSVGGNIDMLLLYDGLKVDIFKIEDGEQKSKKFLNFLVNAVVRDNNPNQPDHPRSKPRHPSVTIERDPYHSSFNYLWQLLRPALTESVGISKTQQKIAGGIVKMITGIKKLFKKEKKDTPPEIPQEEEIQ